MARIGFVVLCLVALLAGLWVFAAVWIDGPDSRPLAGLIAAAYLACTVSLLVWVRPLWLTLAACAALFGVALAWWLSIEPSNDRQWLADVARVPTATIEGTLLTVHNVRNFEYRSEDDFTERWETRTYDLSRLRGMDLFLSYWGPTKIAHTFATWEFEGSAPLAISIETRKEVGESYSAVKGFFRQFELYYVVADERDVARLRTNFRGEQVYLYRLEGSPDTARKVLLDYVDSINRLAAEPTWYNALVHNCTTTIHHHIDHALRGSVWDWRILVNGYIDQAAYEHGTINTSLPFEEVRERSHINERARALTNAANFSSAIRVGLPERPPAP